MATQTINYPHEIDQIDETVAEHKLVDSASKLIKESLVGPSMWAEKARRLVAIHAAHDNTVLLEGESGTGKHFLARLIHQCSRHSEGPFVSVALGSTTDDVARAVLLGRTRLRFDELPEGEKGLLQLSTGGTLYIEDYLDTSSQLAGEVARLTEETGLVRTAGGSVRILLGSATDHRRHQARTSVIPGRRGTICERIQIPPLRERPDDVEALAGHFVKQCCEQLRKELRTLSQNTIGVLRNYDWPRNVAELKSVINHLVRQSKPPALDAAMLPAYMHGPANPTYKMASLEIDLDEEVKQFEVNLICAALRQSRGLQNKAAQLLRIRPTTLFMKIKRYGIDVADFRPPS